MLCFSNPTLNCQHGFLERALQVDSYIWTAANLSTGCTSSCTTGLQQWVTNVQSACAGQTMENLGMYIDPKTLPLMYQHSYSVACLTGGTSGWCIVDSQSWVGSDIKEISN